MNGIVGQLALHGIMGQLALLEDVDSVVWTSSTVRENPTMMENTLLSGRTLMLADM